MHDLMVPPSRIDGTAKIVRALGGPIVGMTEQRPRHPDMLGVVDSELGWDDFAKQVRVEITAKLTLGSATDKLPDLLGGQWLPCGTHPEGVARDRAPRARCEMRAVVIDIPVEPLRQTGKRSLVWLGVASDNGFAVLVMVVAVDPA